MPQMDFATLAREIGFETNYPSRLNKNDLIDWLASKGVIVLNQSNPSADPVPTTKFLDWFEFETVKSRYTKDYQRVHVSEQGILEIKKLFIQWMRGQ
jgi:hypothetical protein